VKYALYEEAVFRFLKKCRDEGRGSPVYIVVVGAGRGPLVAASLQAASRADVLVHIWAVEKNPNAVHTLRHRRRTEDSWRSVEVVASDMRVWQAPRKADLLVSELLGSFGDNELSPECLDGAQRFLKEDGTSIPQSYTSYLTPVSTTKLWDEVRETEKLESIETAYVVKFHEAFYPCNSFQECFAFRHPNWALESNDRYAEVTFQADVDALIHGFAGYFDCELYDGVNMSIYPPTNSDGMFSWFPMYFPLRVPVFLRKGERIRGHWWRRHGAVKAWYEWALSEPVATPLQNPGGRSWTMGM
jgi:protein arginine N-methyltransferase 5